MSPVLCSDRAQGIAGGGGCFLFLPSKWHPGAAGRHPLQTQLGSLLVASLRDLEKSNIEALLKFHRHRRRPEPWNQEETSYGVTYRKLVFAPPVGARSCNVHVRGRGGQNVRYSLLFAITSEKMRQRLPHGEASRSSWRSASMTWLTTDRSKHQHKRSSCSPPRGGPRAMGWVPEPGN